MNKDGLLLISDAAELWDYFKEDETLLGDKDLRDHFTKLCRMQKNKKVYYDENGMHYDPNDMIGQSEK